MLWVWHGVGALDAQEHAIQVHGDARIVQVGHVNDPRVKQKVGGRERESVSWGLANVVTAVIDAVRPHRVPQPTWAVVQCHAEVMELVVGAKWQGH